MFKAEVIKDSVNPDGQRLTTMLVTYPRIIHAEMCRHRMHSRNTASSRAIPFEKMVRDVEENPFIPLAWQKSHKGMQGTEYHTSQESIEDLVGEWLFARDVAIGQAQILSNCDVTKQLCNRLLEPFVWTTELITATEWDNFFQLRINDQAEIHIQKIAELMKLAMNQSDPQYLGIGRFHIPFVENLSFDPDHIHFDSDVIKVAVARCARLSYKTLGPNPKVDYNADLKLYDKLLSENHMSPFEHVAKATSGGFNDNFNGFWSYRKELNSR
jgi:thymidylate synthase ThyX